MHAHAHTYINTCTHTYLHTYIPTYLPTYLGYGVKRSRLAEVEMNLLSEDDVVPQIDRIEGLIMKLPCDRVNPVQVLQLPPILGAVA